MVRGDWNFDPVPRPGEKKSPSSNNRMPTWVAICLIVGTVIVTFQVARYSIWTAEQGVMAKWKSEEMNRIPPNR
jgi:hypothetical protein